MALITYGLALIEGLALIASPCILPVLPLILATSLDGGKSRPLGITVGFITSFCLFAFFSRWIILALGINLDIIKYASLFLLILLALVMLSNTLAERFAAWTQGIANLGSRVSVTHQGGFISGLGIGALIGLIWTPCAGPILAAVLVQVIQQQSNAQGFITLLCFAIGAGIPMLIISLTGRALVTRLGFIKTHMDALRKNLGIIILFAVAFIASGADPAALLSHPNTEATMQNNQTAGLINPLPNPYPAPAFKGIDAWLNSAPLEMASLKGKVVLIDFWTYSCINCVRTLPYVTTWDKKYRDKGLVIIGVHSPEFEFEKNVDNIKAALLKNNIHYPIAVDSNLSTWNNFSNEYWPAQYLIDQHGDVVYTHFGEGDDDVTEHNIRSLLGLTMNAPMASNPEPTIHFNQTPETYLGYARADRFAGIQVKDQAYHTYTLPTELIGNEWALNGSWKIDADKIISGKGGSALQFAVNAQKVFLVMGNMTGKPINVSIKVNGVHAGNLSGKDAPDGTVTVDQHTLYEILDLKTFQHAIIEVQPQSEGLELYAFTFG